MRVPWTARRYNQSILKEISPGCSLEGLMLKLKLQYFDHLIRRTDSLEKTLMLGKIEGRRRRGRQDEMAGWHHRLDGHEFEWTPGFGDGQGGLMCCNSWGRKESDTTERVYWTELPSNGSAMFVFRKREQWLCKWVLGIIAIFWTFKIISKLRMSKNIFQPVEYFLKGNSIRVILNEMLDVRSRHLDVSLSTWIQVQNFCLQVYLAFILRPLPVGEVTELLSAQLFLPQPFINWINCLYLV